MSDRLPGGDIAVKAATAQAATAAFLEELEAAGFDTTSVSQGVAAAQVLAALSGGGEMTVRILGIDSPETVDPS
jgi:hypothetical protein